MSDQRYFLCVCQYGHCRSVALARCLHSRKLNAVAVGTSTAGKETLRMLCIGAHRVLLLDDALAGSLPAEARGKTVSFHVGPDRWVNPYNQELAKILEGMVNAKAGELGL